ncbi:LuxR C-terminal-related transcriptional regulator [Kosakonia sp.]|uniref:helix-turn-helix transcriptional regulator n=1 Tax=Kosakonia sp. TaxID=1916651 RepID=UPI0028A0F7EC|nr:LuxR C-terminal-related transcriptional regulator [Kosakonia sp.]
MLSLSDKQGIIISRMPVLRSGVGGILESHFPEYQLMYYSAVEETTLRQLAAARLIVVDLTGELRHARRHCQQYFTLLPQCENTHWIFLISRSLYPVAMQLLLRSHTTLLAEEEPVETVIRTIREGYEKLPDINCVHNISEQQENERNINNAEMLTFSERKVLRLLGKGWGINQIASLLKKSNKTISAQKNSAMRRLSLRSNADLYSWINSARGIKELNLGTAYGEQKEWNIIAKEATLPSSKSA